MTVKVGDRVPSATLRYVTPDGVQAVSTDDFFRGKKVALFAVPGAFTRTCSQRHLPSYVTNAAELKAKGVDTIACIAVNDQFVMNAWARSTGRATTSSCSATAAATSHGRWTRARPRQRGYGNALAALFDAGRRRRRQGAQCRAAGRVRRLQRRDHAKGALTDRTRTGRPDTPGFEPVAVAQRLSVAPPSADTATAAQVNAREGQNVCRGNAPDALRRRRAPGRPVQRGSPRGSICRVVRRRGEREFRAERCGRADLHDRASRGARSSNAG